MYVKPNQAKIERQHFHEMSLSALPGWNSIIGLQIENLVLNNRKEILTSLAIKPEDIVCDNPYLQKKTKRLPGCQIDYLIQTKFNNLYVCEIKFTSNIISKQIIKEVQTKIDRLNTPKQFSFRPVLIYLGNISDEIIDEQYFYKIIDLADYLDNIN